MFFLDCVNVRENIKGTFSVFYHFANMGTFFKCTLNIYITYKEIINTERKNIICIVHNVA